MERAGENRDEYNLSRRLNGVSRELPRKFVYQSKFPNVNEKDYAEQDQEMELSLGLSLNGRFGAEPKTKKLKRLSSVSDLASTVGSFDNGRGHQPRGLSHEGYAPLARTFSLPAEMDEMCRLKEFQWLKCVGVRKQRKEKLKSVRVGKGTSHGSGEVHNGNGVHEDVNGSSSVKMLNTGFVPEFENWNQMPSSQGQIGSARTASSGVFDQGQPMEGKEQNKSSSSVPFLQKEAVQISAVRDAGNDAKGDDVEMKNALLDMPFVSTRGHGPNCDGIEGFLYRYRTGDNIKIVCVCHGMFLSPAEFVKHGGGGDVAHSLSHIIVSPPALF